MKRWLDNPHHLRLVHLVLAAIWIVPGIPLGWWICYGLPSEHALFAILMVSYWANIYTAVSAWQAARGEEAAKGG